MPTTGICDLPQKLIGEKILTRIPVTSLRQVRSTCKSWDALTKRWILGSTEQFVGFMTMNYKVCSLRFLVKQKGDKKDLVDVSINQVDLLNQVEVSEILHSYGLLLCVAKDKLKLLVWNPYLYQTRWIRPRTKFNDRDKYALGYDMNHNHKILRFMDYYTGGPEEYEIYNFSSDSWKVLDVTPHWEIPPCHRGASVKGNAYFYAQEKLCGDDAGKAIEEIEDFLLCFDFTREKFGPRLPLPFHSVGDDECVTLSCVRDEQLAVLYYQEGMNDHSCGKVEIWVTTRIEPDRVSWSNFLKVDMSPFALTGVKFDEEDGGSFFINEQEKVAVVFDLDGHIPTLKPAPARYHTAFVIGQDGLFESVRLAEAPNFGKRCPRTGYLPLIHIPALVCSSSYRPSLVQVKQPGRKRKRSRD